MTDDKIRNVESMIKDTDNYPLITDIIKQFEIGRTTRNISGNNLMHGCSSSVNIANEFPLAF